MRTEDNILNRIQEDFKIVLEDVRARRLFEYILTMRPKYAFKGENTIGTAFLLGQQSICDAIYDIIKKADRTKLYKMEDEYISFINSFEPDYRKEEEHL